MSHLCKHTLHTWAMKQAMILSHFLYKLSSLDLKFLSCPVLCFQRIFFLIQCQTLYQLFEFPPKEIHLLFQIESRQTRDKRSSGYLASLLGWICILGVMAPCCHSCVLVKCTLCFSWVRGPGVLACLKMSALPGDLWFGADLSFRIWGLWPHCLCRVIV